jgi:DNA adenine methylase
MKSHKTPLRYPGGKSRACTKMDPYFPDLRNYEEFREPFLGGGSVSIHITKKYPDLKIWVNDLYEPLVNFWQQLQMFGVDMKKTLTELKPESYSSSQRNLSIMKTSATLIEQLHSMWSTSVPSLVSLSHLLSLRWHQ